MSGCEHLRRYIYELFSRFKKIIFGFRIKFFCSRLYYFLFSINPNVVVLRGNEARHIIFTNISLKSFFLFCFFSQETTYLYSSALLYLSNDLLETCHVCVRVFSFPEDLAWTKNSCYIDFSCSISICNYLIYIFISVCIHTTYLSGSYNI